MGSMPQESHFKRIQNFKADYTDAEFTQYESQRTGMRVVAVDRKGPKVYGYFALATEIHDDSGAPHTLEHLCFMGSRKYPFKGVLDQVATRAYSDTNAWTDTAETVYSLATAGWEGFAQILPIYLDHIVLPTLTDAGCYTEVHHIDGKGKDAGVVYAEMQGRENLQGDILDLRMRQLLYAEDDGYRYETGGMTKALRVLTAERIRQFHREMYQPKNLRLVIVGEIDHPNLLEVLDRFEDDIVDQVPAYDAPFKRPWIDTKRTEPLKESVVETIEFPETDEEMGEVQIGFLGPESKDDKLETAIHTICLYLSGSSVSVLVNTLVEKEHLASMVYFWVKNHYDQVIWFTLSAVETDKLAEAERRFFEVLKDHASRPLDMNYLIDCLHRFRRQVRFTSEVGNDEYKDPIIKDHLFGARDGSDLETGLKTLTVFDELLAWTEEDWRALLKKWISDAHHVSLLGKPSKAFGDRLKEEEEKRIKEQQEKLGEEGMKSLTKKLEEAQAENEKPIPEHLIKDLKVPGTDSIHFFETLTARSGLAKQNGTSDSEIQQIIDKDENGLPLYIHFEHIRTSFVHFGLALGTASIPTELKPLLGVYMTNIFTTPIMKDGKRMEYEEVITRLEQDTVEYGVDRGSDIGNAEMVYIQFVGEADKFDTMVKWLASLLVDGIFEKERLVSTVKKMLADVPDEKRDGNSMVFSIDRMVHYQPASSVRATNTLVKGVYLKKVLRQLETEPEQVISQLKALQSHLLTFENMRLLAIADLKSLPNPVSTFKRLTDVIPPPSSPQMRPINSKKALLSPLGRNPGGYAAIVDLPIDSSFGVWTCRGPESYTSPEQPPLMVALAYLDAVEGPMWQSIRGTGLAYGANFYRDPEAGILKFRVYKSPNVFSAFEKARDVVKEYGAGERRLEKLALEGAISSIVREFVDDKSTIIDAARGSFVDLAVKGLDKGYSDWVLREVRQVGEEDVRRVLREIVVGVFDPLKADLMVVCGENSREYLKDSFTAAGFAVRPEHKISDFQDGYGVADDEEMDDDDDEEDSEEEEDSDEDMTDAEAVAAAAAEHDEEEEGCGCGKSAKM